MPKILFQLYIDIDQFDYVAEKAKKTDRSRASIVREAIEQMRKGDWKVRLQNEAE